MTTSPIIRILANNNPIIPRPAFLPPHFPQRPHLLQRPLLVRHLPLMLISSNATIIPIVVFKGIGFFAVHRIIPDLAQLIRHAQGHAADVFDEDHDEGGPEDVPADDEKGADDLETDLTAVARDCSAWIGDAESRTAFFCGPEIWKGQSDSFGFRR